MMPEKVCLSPDSTPDLWRQERLINQYQDLDFWQLGLPVVSTDAIYLHFQERINGLLDCSGLNADEQELFIVRPLRRLIDCVHLLPAAKAYHHSKIGGLVAHTIEVARIACETVKASAPDNFNGQDATNKQWVLGAILSGLLHDVGKVYDALIYDAKGQDIFSPDTSVLSEWLAARTDSVYTIKWIGKGRDHRRSTAKMLASHNLISKDTFDFLGKTVADAVVNCLTLLPSKLQDPLIKADIRSVSRYITLDPSNESLGYLPYVTAADIDDSPVPKGFMTLTNNEDSMTAEQMIMAFMWELAHPSGKVLLINGRYGWHVKGTEIYRLCHTHKCDYTKLFGLIYGKYPKQVRFNREGGIYVPQKLNPCTREKIPQTA